MNRGRAMDLAAQAQTLQTLLYSSYTAALSYQHHVLLLISRVKVKEAE